MNISSAIVIISELNSAEIILQIKAIAGCEIHLMEGNKLIVTIEGENVEVETGILKCIEGIKGVSSATMVYAYSENELESERQKVEFSSDLPAWLNHEVTDAKDISYAGRLKF